MHVVVFHQIDQEILGVVVSYASVDFAISYSLSNLKNSKYVYFRPKTIALTWKTNIHVALWRDQRLRADEGKLFGVNFIDTPRDMFQIIDTPLKYEKLNGYKLYEVSMSISPTPNKKQFDQTWDRISKQCLILAKSSFSLIDKY